MHDYNIHWISGNNLHSLSTRLSLYSLTVYCKSYIYSSLVCLYVCIYREGDVHAVYR